VRRKAGGNLLASKIPFNVIFEHAAMHLISGIIGTIYL